MPAERVRKTDDHVEEGRDVDRVHERVPAHACGEHGFGIFRGQGVRLERELLEESERRA